MAGLYLVRPCRQCRLDTAVFERVHTKKGKEHTTSTSYSGSIHTYLMILGCVKCGASLTLEVGCAGPLPQSDDRPMDAIGGLVIRKEYTAVVSPASDVPSNLPGELPEIFKEAVASLDLHPRRPHAAGMLLRKVLEVGTKNIDPSITRMDFAPRIRHLADKGLITSAMADWADQVRFGGNDGAHDEPPLSDSDLDELRDFARLFLLYAFSLPSVVERRKQEREAKKAKK